jgi:hypothetical protein
VVGAGPPTPNPPTPNPQSPIPNPHYIILKIDYLIKKYKLFIKIKLDN